MQNGERSEPGFGFAGSLPRDRERSEPSRAFAESVFSERLAGKERKPEVFVLLLQGAIPRCSGTLFILRG